MRTSLTRGKIVRWQVGGLVVLILLSSLLSFRGWFCGDDAVTLLDAAQVVHNPLSGFGPGTFGRFRPLRLFSIAPIYAFAGTKWVFPYHVLSLALHILNVILTWRLLRRMINSDPEPIAGIVPYAAAVIAAVHAAGTEAVTYISAIGMVFSTTGTLLCCHAVRDLPKPRGFLLLAAGMLIAIGGGYAMPTILVVLLCALWPRDDSPRRLEWKNAALAAAVVVPLTALYAIIEKLLIVHDFEKQARFEPLFMLGQFVDNVARLTLPSTFVNEPITYSLLIAAAVAIVALKPLRQTFLQPRVWLLLAISLASLVPYAPSALGNRDRFCYLPAPFFAAFWLLMAVAAFRFWLRKSEPTFRATLAAIALLLIVNIAGMQIRMGNMNRCGDALRDFTARMHTLKQSAPNQRLRVFMTTDDLEQALRMLELQTIIKYEDGILGMPLTPWPPPGETWVLASYRKRHPFETKVLSTPK